MSQIPLSPWQHIPPFTFTSTPSAAQQQQAPPGLSFSSPNSVFVQTSHLGHPPSLNPQSIQQIFTRQPQQQAPNGMPASSGQAGTHFAQQHFNPVPPQRGFFIPQSSPQVLSNVSAQYQAQLSMMDIQERPDGLEATNLKNTSEFTSYLESFGDKDTYFCQICHNLLWQPVSCANCVKIYCKECIGHWVESSTSCPTCRERFQPKKIEKSIQNNLNKLTFACSAHSTGCTEFITYENLLKHQNVCEFKTVSCSNTGCEFTAIRKNMAQHAEICEHHLLACQWCSRFIKRMNSVQHEEICEMKILGCENQGCCESLTRAEMNIHISQCPFNIVRCEMCSLDFTLKDIHTHKQSCDFMVVFCRGCNASMYKKHITTHEESCDHVELQCPDCTHIILRKDLATHDQISCLKAGQRILLESKTQLQCENACLKKDVETMKLCIAHLYEQVQELVNSRRSSFPKISRADFIQK